MLHRHYPASSLLRASPPPRRPDLALAGFPLCRFAPSSSVSRASRAFLRSMPSSQPRRNRRVRLSLASPVALAFPGCPTGRLPHLSFSRSRRTFTCVTAWIFAGSPSDPLSRRLRQVRFLPCRFNSYWASDSSQAGLPPAETHTHSRRTDTQLSSLPKGSPGTPGHCINRRVRR